MIECSIATNVDWLHNNAKENGVKSGSGTITAGFTRMPQVFAGTSHDNELIRFFGGECRDVYRYIVA